MDKAGSYQLWFNNSSPNNKTPLQLILDKDVKVNTKITFIPPIDLAALFSAWGITMCLPLPHPYY